MAQDHPLRVIRQIANAALKSLSCEFDALYSPIGRESIPPERQLVERIDDDLLFRWFVGLGIEDPVWGCHHVHQEPRPAVGRRGGG